MKIGATVGRCRGPEGRDAIEPNPDRRPEPMEHDRQPTTRRGSRRARALATLAFLCWTGGAVTFLTLVYVNAPRAAEVIGALDVSVPVATSWLIGLGRLLHENEVLAIAAAALAATTMPFVLGMRGRLAAQVYGVLALAALLASAATWFALVHVTESIDATVGLPSIPAPFK